MYPNKQPHAAYRDSVGVEFDEALSADALDAALPRRRWRVLRMHRSPYALAASAYRYHVGLGAEKEAWLTRVPAREVVAGEARDSLSFAAGRDWGVLEAHSWHEVLASVPERNGLLLEALRARRAVAQMARDVRASLPASDVRVAHIMLEQFEDNFGAATRRSLSLLGLPPADLDALVERLAHLRLTFDAQAGGGSLASALTEHTGGSEGVPGGELAHHSTRARSEAATYDAARQEAWLAASHEVRVLCPEFAAALRDMCAAAARGGLRPPGACAAAA